MDQPGVQQVFFQHVKANLAAHLSLVDEVADLLNISNDSAYRRIRGEKPLSFEELKSLCSHYRISLDQLFQLNNDSFLFSGPLTNKDNFGLDKYLEQLPHWVWLSWIPQLLLSLQRSEAQHCKLVLLKIAQVYPQVKAMLLCLYFLNLKLHSPFPRCTYLIHTVTGIVLLASYILDGAP